MYAVYALCPLAYMAVQIIIIIIIISNLYCAYYKKKNIGATIKKKHYNKNYYKPNN